jgi:hypothetical protein
MKSAFEIPEISTEEIKKKFAINNVHPDQEA